MPCATDNRLPQPPSHRWTPPPNPLPQVRPVTADAHDLSGYYQCPVYTNMQRANVYSPVVSTFTLRSGEAPHKWVLASVALLLQDDLA